MQQMVQGNTDTRFRVFIQQIYSTSLINLAANIRRCSPETEGKGVLFIIFPKWTPQGSSFLAGSKDLRAETWKTASLTLSLTGHTDIQHSRTLNDYRWHYTLPHPVNIDTNTINSQHLLVYIYLYCVLCTDYTATYNTHGSQLILTQDPGSRIIVPMLGILLWSSSGFNLVQLWSYI